MSFKYWYKSMNYEGLEFVMCVDIEMIIFCSYCFFGKKN